MTTPLFTLDAIRTLAELLTETGLSEIEVSGKEGHVRLARQLVSAPAAVVVPSNAAPPPIPAPPTAQANGKPVVHPGAIKSPMVGIVYLAPEPGAPPFVTEGQAVEAGQTLLLIEAMKTFNQIKAPKSGTVTRILVTPGAPVEYDEPLMILE